MVSNDISHVFRARMMVLDQLHGVFASMNPIWKLDQLWMLERRRHTESPRPRPRAILYEVWLEMMSMVPIAT